VVQSPAGLVGVDLPTPLQLTAGNVLASAFVDYLCKSAKFAIPSQQLATWALQGTTHSLEVRKRRLHTFALVPKKRRQHGAGDQLYCTWWTTAIVNEGFFALLQLAS
jgi:hypothetical protein